MALGAHPDWVYWMEAEDPPLTTEAVAPKLRLVLNRAKVPAEERAAFVADLRTNPRFVRLVGE